MPIIEYIHSRRIHRVTRARTVEWNTRAHSFDDDVCAPFLGIDESEEYDCPEVFEFEDENEAFAKMAELWAEWQKEGFIGVTHA